MGVLIKGPWPEPPHRNLSKYQVSQQFGVHHRTIERWMNAGLPYDRDADGHARFRRREVQEYLESRSEMARTGDDAA